MATRANVSIQELQDVITKSGVPTAGKFLPPDASSIVRGQISETVRGQRAPQIEAARREYLTSIDKIAQADRKISRAFSDPSSKLFLENPLEREAIATGAEDIGFQEAGRLAGNIQRLDDETESIISQAVSLFDNLKKTPKPKKSDEQKLLDKQRKEAGLDLAELAGIEDPEAQDAFLDKTGAFQDFFLRQQIRAPQTVTKETIEQSFADWTEKFGRTKTGNKSTKSSGSNFRY